MTTAPRPRSRRLLVVLVTLAAWLVVGLLVVRSDWFSRRLAHVVEGLLEGVTGEAVTISAVRIRPWHRAVSVEGLVMQHRSDRLDHDGRTIIAVEDVTVAFGLRSMRPRIRRIEIQRPSVRLHLDEGRLREFQGVPRQAGGGEGPPATELPWDELYIRDGVLNLSAAYGGEVLTEFELADLDALPGAVEGTMVLDIGKARFRLGDVEQIAQAVHLPDLVVTPSRVAAPDVSLAFPDLTVDGAIDLDPNGPVEGLFTIGTRLAAWNPLLPDRVATSGQVELDLELSGRTDAPIIGGTLLASDLLLEVIPPPERQRKGPTTYDFGDISAAWRVRERQLLLEPLEAEWAGGELVVNGAVDLASKGVWASITAHDLQLAGVLKALDASPAPWVDMGADLEIQAAGTVQPLRMAGSWTLAGTNLLAASGPVPATPPMLALSHITARGQLDVTQDGMTVIARPLATPRSRGRVEARIGFGPVGPLDIDLDLDDLALAELAPLADMGLAGQGILRGRLGGPFDNLTADAILDVVDLELWGLPFADEAHSELRWYDKVHLSFPDIRGSKGETPLKAAVELTFEEQTRLDLNLLVPGGRLSDVMGIFLDVPGLDASMQGSLELRGPVGALDGESRVELRDVNLFGEHFERGEARGWMDDGHFTLEEAVVWRADGAEALAARGSVGAGWATNIDLVAGGLSLAEMDLLEPLGGLLDGQATLDAQVGGTLFEPEPRGLLRLHDTRLARKVVEDSALSFETRDGVLVFGGQLASGGQAPAIADLTGGLPERNGRKVVEGLTLAGSLGLWEAQAYDIDLDLRRFPISLLYAEAPDGSPISSTLSGRVGISGNFGDVPSPVDINASLTDTTLNWGRHDLAATGPWTWQQQGEDFAVEGLTLVGGQTDLSFSGQRRKGGPTRFGGGGTVDLDMLRMVVPGLLRADGIGAIDVRAVSQDGKVRPEIELAAEDLTVRGDWFPASFEDVEVRIRATPDMAVIDSLTGRLGGGLVSGSGTIGLSSFMPRRYDLTARADQARVQYFDWLPAAQGDAQLSFSGPSDSPLLSGLIVVTDMLFSDRIDWESWVLEVSNEVMSGAVEETGEDWFAMELSIDADRSIRVRNNVADLTASGELRVIGDTARPGLVGRVRSEAGGRVYLKEREFELLRGEVRFVNPFAYDPELDFALTTDVRSSEEEYRIDAQVSGVWSDWRTSTRSDPALPQADVNALLVFGMTRDEMERTGALGRALAIEGSDVLFSSIGIVSRAEEGIFRLRGLQPLLDPLRPDRLDLVSGTSERGSGAVSSELRLLYENELDDIGWRGGLLLIEQNVAGGQDTYVGLEQRLAKRLYLRGWWSNEQEERFLSIGGAYGIEVNVRWELD